MKSSGIKIFDQPSGLQPIVTTGQFPQVTEITVDQLPNYAPPFQLLDVRQLDEYREGHIPGITHIPLNELHTRFQELDKSVPVIASCKSGRRSAFAADFLAKQGFNVVSLRGGIEAWKLINGNQVEVGMQSFKHD